MSRFLLFLLIAASIVPYLLLAQQKPNPQLVEAAWQRAARMEDIVMGQEVTSHISTYEKKENTNSYELTSTKREANPPCGRRHPSTTAPQSLSLLNSVFSATRATDLATCLSSESNADTRVEKAFLLTLGRLPTDGELSDSRSFIQRISLEEFTLSLLNLNESVHID